MTKNNDFPLLNPDFVREVVALINAGARVIQIRSHERERVRELAEAIASHPDALKRFKKASSWCLFHDSWNILNGKLLKKDMDEAEPVKQLKEDVSANPGVWVLEDYHHLVGPNADSMTKAQAIDFLANISDYADSLIILGGKGFEPPQEVCKDIVTLDLPLPDAPILRHIAFSCTGLKDKLISDEAIEAARGLTLSEARRTFLKAYQATVQLTGKESLTIISEAKGQAIRESKQLEYFDVQGHEMTDVGGMENVKTWLAKRKVGLSPASRAMKLDAPKGLLLLGVQGCGKSLLAKTVAHEWNLPLLRFDLGKVMSMWLGESEGNIRAALNLADAMAPCVLWIDEIEKGIPKSGPFDEGTGLRVLGTILTWMQEKKQPVFVVATANSVTDLPPELLRKGRFDEIFFVDLPGPAAREKIFDIHTRKRGQPLQPSEIRALAESTHGFSGAEIESAVSEALYNWAYEREQSDARAAFEIRHIQQAIKDTRPLSVLMADKIDALREWARSRARPAAGTEA
jgi:ATP-dependent 26S proteasome regulatory subunit